MKFWIVSLFIFTLSLTQAHASSPLKFKEIETPFGSSTLYLPEGEIHGGVIVLHGSEGGSLPYHKLEAQFLAAHGYASLAFCWYNCRKNPITSAYSPLENIELRKTIQAIDWLKKTPAMSGKRLAIAGFSRGAEQAAVLGTLHDAIELVDAIAIHTPSDIIEPGVNWAGADKRCWLCKKGDLSCFNNSDNYEKWDFDNMSWNPACKAMPKMPDDPTNVAWLIDGMALPLKSVIELEKFKKPVFITVGDHDEIWDSKKSLRLAERLKKFAMPVQLHVFNGELHNFSPENENLRHELLLNFLNSYVK